MTRKIIRIETVASPVTDENITSDFADLVLK